MSGSEFERENIVADALSAAPDSKPAAALGDSRCASTPGVRRPKVSTTPPRKRIPAASASSPTSRARSRIRSSPTRSTSSATSNIAARSAPIRAPATAPAFWCRSRTRFFARKAAELGFELPKPGEYAVGALFMPSETAWRKVIKSIIADQIKAEGLTLLGWREVPTDNSSLGETVKPTEPAHMQVFIGRNGAVKTEDEFERRLYILRKSISQAIYQRRDRGLAGYYPVSMSCRTVIYKGMFLADQLGNYYPDLQRAGFRERAGAGASALLDQHLPDLVAGAPLPHDRAQRRDQHAARQRQLDGGAAGLGAFGPVRQGHQPALADLL